MLNRWSPGIPLLLACATGPWLAASATRAGEPVLQENPPATVWTYADGEDGYFAVSLTARGLEAPAVASRDHVMLIDTSASQVGEHRQQALAVAREFLAALPAADRVRIFAVDLGSTELTRGFVAPQAPEIDEALAALRRRVPLGATNLESAMQVGVEALEAGRTGSILYIGDGMSTANLLQSESLTRLIGELHGRQIPVHSYAVGPRTDLQLLGILGLRTGGAVYFDRADEQADAPANVGRALAEAVAAPVYYPTSIAVEPAGVELLPAVALPVRPDRETVYLGRGAVDGDIRVVLSTDDAAMTWSAPAGRRQHGASALRALWDQAEQSDGLTVAFAGDRLLFAAHNAFDDQVAAMTAAGQLAAAQGDRQEAQRIAQQIQALDPQNDGAEALLASAAGGPGLFLAQAEERDPLISQVPDEDIPAAPDDLILQQRQLEELNAQRLQLLARNAITEARNIVRTNPDAALAIVKDVTETVRSTADVSPGVRRELLRELGNVQLELQRDLEAIAISNRQLLERQAQVAAQRRLLVQLQHDEEELQLLIERVRALMQDGFHGDDLAFEDAEATARVAVNVRPGNAPATAALFRAIAAGQLNKAFRLRSLRAERYLETLYQVELSHVPFPDEPPIRWPPAEVWRALTERRRKWASVDLKRDSPAEQRIEAALVDPAGVEILFVEIPLREAMEFLADAHNITIYIDETALQEEGISTDDPINVTLSGITLRSALRIILEPLGLTYVIEDEVLKITTETRATEIFSTRVYPVGDLVIPIITPLAGGLGQGFGGVGGFQGQGGFGQGGQFGAGSTSFGGGGIGGQGFFSLPKPAMPAAGPKAQPAVDPQADQILHDILGGQARTNGAGRFEGQAFAQVRDPQGLDNAAVESVKKKLTPAR